MAGGLQAQASFRIPELGSGRESSLACLGIEAPPQIDYSFHDAMVIQHSLPR